MAPADPARSAANVFLPIAEGDDPCPSCGDPAYTCADPENCPRDASAAPPAAQERELRELLAETYTPEGVELWLAHADKQGWAYEERLSRALAAADGNFS